MSLKWIKVFLQTYFLFFCQTNIVFHKETTFKKPVAKSHRKKYNFFRQQQKHLFLCPSFKKCKSFLFYVLSQFETANDHLIEFHLTEIDIFHLTEIVVISWPNFWTLFTWSKLKIMNSVKCLNLGVWPNYSVKRQNP